MSEQTSGQDDNFAQVANAFQDIVQGPAKESAAQLEQIFANAGKRIASELDQAARSGTFSFQRMVESILKDMARIAVKQAVGGVFESILGQVIGGGFAGARADGGPVLSGGAYLVGEHGPEIFRPTNTGNIDAVGTTAPVVVNFHLGSGVGIDEFRRSQGQINTMLSKAVAAGRRRQ